MVTLGFSPATAWGGPVKLVHQNAIELICRGHQVTVYCSNLLDKHHKIQPGTFENSVDGIRVVYFNTWNIPSWPGTLGPIWLPDLPRYIKREIYSYDIVHINGYRNFINLPVILAARKMKIPIIMQPHGGLPRIINSFFLKRLYDTVFGKIELNDLTALIAGQESEVRQAIAQGVDSEIIEIINNGIDISALNKEPDSISFRKKIGLDSNIPLVLFLGRINRKKGTDMLVEAFSILKDDDVFLAIVGPDDGQLEEAEDVN